MQQVLFGAAKPVLPCRAHLAVSSAAYSSLPHSCASRACAAPAEVWAFGPPGELCSADVAAAIAASCRMTAVALAVDAAPRTTAVSLAALMDQAVVGLARLR